jgi:aryl-alcohol dehydrogenase-like predicted oxidoreductase
MSSEALPHRPLGKTGLDVSGLGYGAWGIGGTGWVGADDSESLQALRRSFELGVDFVDTALGYGDGHSETLVGQAVAGRAETIVVATKVPPLNRQWPARPGVHANEAFPADWIVSCTERSLRNLGLETIDVQQFHVWSEEWLGQGDWLEAVEQLKRDGKIRFFGVSINDHSPGSALGLVESGHVDTVQVIYNVFDQSPEDELFPAARAAGVGVVARVPFDEGALTGSVRPDTVFPPGDFRNNYFRGERRADVWRHVQALARALDVPVERLPEIALRFCISDGTVSTVIPGMRSVANVEKNAAAFDTGPLDAEQLRLLRKHRWARNYY